MQDVKRPVDPKTSAQVKFQIEHLRGTETSSLRLHAQYFALFFIPSVIQRTHQKEKGFLKKNLYLHTCFFKINICIC